MSPKIELQNAKEFTSLMKKAAKQAGDLTIPLTLIAKDFLKSEQGIFDPSRKGPGQYVDLKPNYKKWKQKEVGFVYPILRLHGALAKSLTEPGAKDQVLQIVNKQMLVIGTRVWYAKYLQEKRPFVIIGPEAPTYATDRMKGRPERWMKYLQDHMDQVAERASREK